MKYLRFRYSLRGFLFAWLGLAVYVGIFEALKTHFVVHVSKDGYRLVARQPDAAWKESSFMNAVAKATFAPAVWTEKLVRDTWVGDKLQVAMPVIVYKDAKAIQRLMSLDYIE